VICRHLSLYESTPERMLENRAFNCCVDQRMNIRQSTVGRKADDMLLTLENEHLLGVFLRFTLPNHVLFKCTKIEETRVVIYAKIGVTADLPNQASSIVILNRTLIPSSNNSSIGLTCSSLWSPS